MTPFPGTELYDSLQKDKRIVNNDFTFYDGSHIVFKPKRIDMKSLEKEYWILYKKFYSIFEIFKKLIRANKKEFLYILFTNLRFRNLVYRNVCPYNSGIQRIQ